MYAIVESWQRSGLTEQRKTAQGHELVRHRELVPLRTETSAPLEHEACMVVITLASGTRIELRLQKSLSVLNTISAWLAAEIKNTQPRSPIGNAMQYCVRLWDELMAYRHNGHLDFDNNLMENAIRPVALGRKNWLFAGLHAAAENIAMYRSFFATCHANDVKPYDWLRTVLLRIKLHSASALPHPAAAQGRPQHAGLTRNM
jgi:hypothetical protein